MDRERKTQPGALVGMFAALIWAAANVLFMKHVGHWLVYSGGVCVALAVAVWVASLMGQARLRIALSNLLLVLTLVNFNAWAFSHLANLVFYLGLFFFLLFALLMGSTLFRFLSAFRPVNKSVLIAGGACCVVLSWAGGLVLEASYLPTDAYNHCLKSPRLRRLPSGVTSEQLKKEIPDQARRFLVDHYGPNLTLSYLRWEWSSGEIEITIEGMDKSLTYQRSQRRVGFMIRLLVSLLFVVYAVFSQVSMLDLTEEEARGRKIARAERKRAGERSGTALPAR